MKTKHIETTFATMGARFKVNVTSENHSQRSDYALDIRRDQFGEFFELRVSGMTSQALDVSVPHCSLGYWRSVIGHSRAARPG